MKAADDNLIQTAREHGLATVDLASLTFAPEVLALVPPDFARAEGIMPFACAGNILHVAIADPLAIDPVDRLAFLLNRPVFAALASAADIRQAIARAYDGNGVELPEPAVAAVPAAPGPEEGQVSASDAPLIRLVQAIITEGIRRRASDIHLEPMEKRFRVRYRVDGVLLEADAPPPRLQAAIVSRLKIMADLSIAEKRLPQDGRLHVQAGGRALDLRVSSLPTVHGESIVMRILDREPLKLGLPELGFWPDDQREIERQVQAPDGIVLVTGPTGSGKTTTLYGCLHHLNRTGRKIITVEDPVEYRMSGINQVPVNAAIGLTFAAALRAMLRQAPNVVMVGEIRDRETAEIALNASLTGHLVFSTLHTNDAPAAITRLVDMGARPFLVAAALRASVAQRLVRRICPHCRRPHTPSARELQALGVSAPELAGATFARGAGCAACLGTGYRGRLGLFEIFLITDEIRHLIHDRAGASRLRAQAQRAGWRTLRQDGVRKVLAGHTTIEEVVAATVADAPRPTL